VSRSTTTVTASAQNPYAGLTALEMALEMKEAMRGARG
jgi:hypothetical protein